MISKLNAALLTSLQKGLPVTAHPFAELAAAHDTTEEYIFNLLDALRKDGLLRRFGAIYDARRIGYHSVLCAATIPSAELSRIAQYACACPGVTHCYERGIPGDDTLRPNLWFTLAAPAADFDATLKTLKSQFAPYDIYALPASRRFKIDVVFDLNTRRRDEKTEPATPLTDITAKANASVFTLSQDEWAIVKAMQNDIPIQSAPFAHLAKQLGIAENALLEKISDWQAKGIIRRIGAILHHNKAGFTANGMCCWPLEDESRLLTAGRKLAEQPEVTHCYERPAAPNFPYRLYAMIHANTRENAMKTFAALSKAADLKNGIVLFSLQEFKKTSLQF